MRFKNNFFWPVFFVILAIAWRCLRHFGVLGLPPNFSPITALALFAGAYLPNRRLAIGLPLLAMLMSDFIIGFYDLKILFAVYLSFALSGFLGLRLRSRLSLGAVFGSSLAASLIFYCLTNFAVWLWSGMYGHSFEGLISCYTLALPFFKGTLLGDLVFVSLFFGLSEIINRVYSYKQKGICAVNIYASNSGRKSTRNYRGIKTQS